MHLITNADIQYVPFLSSLAKNYTPLNLNRLQYFIDSGRLNPNEAITMHHLWKSGAVKVGRKEDGVKLVGTVSCYPIKFSRAKLVNFLHHFWEDINYANALPM